MTQSCARKRNGIAACRPPTSIISATNYRLITLLPLLISKKTHFLELLTELVFPGPPLIDRHIITKEKQGSRGHDAKHNAEVSSCFPSPEDGGARDAVDAQREGAHAEVTVVAPAHLLHVPEGARHVRPELRVHLLLVPHEPLDILNNPKHVPTATVQFTLQVFCSLCRSTGTLR